MAYQFPADVEKLVREQMAAKGYTSEDDVLRDALHALAQFAHSPEEVEEENRRLDATIRELEEEYPHSLATIRQGIADWQAGTMGPPSELLRELYKIDQSVFLKRLGRFYQASDC